MKYLHSFISYQKSLNVEALTLDSPQVVAFLNSFKEFKIHFKLFVCFGNDFFDFFKISKVLIEQGTMNFVLDPPQYK